MKQKQKYVAPGLTVVQFKAERGFAASLGSWSVNQTVNTINEMIAEQALLDADGELTAASMNGQYDYTNVGNSSDWHYMGNGTSWF